MEEDFLQNYSLIRVSAYFYPNMNQSKYNSRRVELIEAFDCSVKSTTVCANQIIYNFFSPPVIVVPIFFPHSQIEINQDSYSDRV